MPIFSGITISGGLSILAIPPPTLNYGFTSGGQYNASSIQRFTFAAEATTINSGSLSDGDTYVTGISSSTNGYTCGGFSGSRDQIRKWPFAISSGQTSTTIGNLNKQSWGSSGSNSSENGYVTGGFLVPNGSANKTSKFSFATDGNAIAQITNSVAPGPGRGGNSSNTHGYWCIGRNEFFPNTSTPSPIYKFPFAADVAGSSIGTVSAPGTYVAGQNSSTHGYISGGYFSGPTYTNRIAKFPFSTDTSATNVGTLTYGRAWAVGQSSDTAGYNSGGTFSPSTVPSPIRATIGYEKFLFASDATSTNAGSMITRANASAGHQG